MLQVNVDKILPVTEARDKFNQLVDNVEGTDELYVLTKNGKPAAVVVGVNHLEKLTGENDIQSIAAGTVASQFSNDSDQSENTPNQPDDSLTETVFASADDALASSRNSLATEDNTPLDLASPAPSAPSTEFQGAVSEPSPAPTTTEDDPIKPVPDNFSSAIPQAEPATDSQFQEIVPTQEDYTPEEPAIDLSSQNTDNDGEENTDLIDPFSFNNDSSDQNDQSGNLGNTISGK